MNFWFILILVAIVVGLVSGEIPQCEELVSRSVFQDQNTIVETTPKTLSGTWLSEGCETRPGPEYVLRHYSFQEDGKYKLIQHHYWDDSCSSPKLTIISNGQIKTSRDSFLHHDALGGYLKPTNITVIPQDFKATKELDFIVSSNCPGQYWKSWRRYEEHVVYTGIKHLNYRPLQNFEFIHLPQSMQNHHDRNTKHNLQNSSGVIGCLGNLKWVFDELRLLKIQLRPNSNALKKSEMHWELLLGDIPSRSNLRENYKPSGFQIPLIKINKGETVIIRSEKYFVKHSCNICPNLLANERTPPHLIERPHLPPYLWGEWISERCEVRPLGLYLTRKFSFYKEQMEWVGEHKFYEDPFCAILKFVITASGSFILNGINYNLQEASNIDFGIQKAALTIFNQDMLDFIPIAKCGRDVWKFGVSQELSFAGGCLPLGITIPSIQYDIVKVEMNYQGSWLLFLGQADTENSPRPTGERPTAFQAPLVKCTDGRSQDFTDEPYYQGYGNSGCRRIFYLNCWIFITFVSLVL